MGEETTSPIFPFVPWSWSVLFLLMTILSQSLFAFVGSHLVAFSFLSAWHIG
jgi:hypothetical protein